MWIYSDFCQLVDYNLKNVASILDLDNMTLLFHTVKIIKLIAYIGKINNSVYSSNSRNIDSRCFYVNSMKEALLFLNVIANRRYFTVTLTICMGFLFQGILARRKDC